MSRYKLTRESILDGSLRAASQALLGVNARYLSDEERARQIEQALVSAPDPDAIWVFGYGSLMWNPAFHFAERRTARIHGYHRQFCLWARAGRGSPERPGLMLGIEPGGSCNGVIYRIAPGLVKSELDVLWRREMNSAAYRPEWVAARTRERTVHAITFAVNRSHERYIGDLDLVSTARYLAQGAGPLGLCCDYLFETVTHLRELGVRDRHLEVLEAHVRMHCGRGEAAVQAAGERSCA
ncbi:MAG: gamma-glutamylcyclotransferase [Betaproteobacteria bacterium]|nr:gamma-glutamylcyclotransferase [Betaproteobacteria bacterium]